MQGKKGLLPDKFTCRNCAGKVAEIFDLLGKFTPITAGLKLDLSELLKRNLDWDDYVPDELKNAWLENFELIQRLGQVRFRRAVIPEDALNLEMETIEMADANQNLACSAIYGRFKLKSGSYSCQLLFSRSKIVPAGMSMPRAELFAALLNATTGHVVYMALKKYIRSRINLTDSQVTLFWIGNTKLQLRQWARNQVVEINRLTDRANWFYIETKNMTADLGTRKGTNIKDVLENSSWRNGQSWARLSGEKFPIKSANEIKLGNNDQKLYNDEHLVLDHEWISSQLSLEYNKSYATISKGVLSNIAERYKFSQYVIDPNKFRFRKVVRILALVHLFIRNLKLKTKFRSNLAVHFIKQLPAQFGSHHDKYLVTQEKNKAIAFPFNCKKGLVVTLSDECLIALLFYFYKKATLEIKHFLSKNAYKHISKERNEVLYFTGRILPSQEFDGKLNLSDVCVDRTMASFCVPIVDKFSPLAYALINEIHWYNADAMHSGNETIMRYVQKIAYIMEGRSLMKKFRKDCVRCRILIKKSIEVAMGPISNNNLSIAPAFFVSQVDIFGHFLSYSNVNKRATIKNWFVVFCCCTTGTVDVKVMEDYSTTSFVLAFVRFSCKVGYPKRLLPACKSDGIKLFRY